MRITAIMVICLLAACSKPKSYPETSVGVEPYTSTSDSGYLYCYGGGVVWGPGRDGECHSDDMPLRLKAGLECKSPVSGQNFGDFWVHYRREEPESKALWAAPINQIWSCEGGKWKENLDAEKELSIRYPQGLTNERKLQIHVEELEWQLKFMNDVWFAMCKRSSGEWELDEFRCTDVHDSFQRTYSEHTSK